MNAKKKLDVILSENPDPSKWSKWIKLAMAILSALLAALCGDALDVCASVDGLF